MTKLSVKANPTFDADVAIPVAGGKSVPVRFTFKHRTKSGLAEFTATRADKEDTESFLEMVVGWDLAEPFSPEAVAEFLENYGGAAVAVFRSYVDELTKAREKN